QQHSRRSFVTDHLQSLNAIARSLHLPATLFEHIADDATHAWTIIHHQDMLTTFWYRRSAAGRAYSSSARSGRINFNLLLHEALLHSLRSTDSITTHV